MLIVIFVCAAADMLALIVYVSAIQAFFPVMCFIGTVNVVVIAIVSACVTALAFVGMSEFIVCGELKLVRYNCAVTASAAFIVLCVVN